MLQNFNIYTKIGNNNYKTYEKSDILSKKLKILLVVIVISIITILSCSSVIYYYKAKENQPLMLKSKDNHIALYKGKQLIEVYDDININNLTDYDRKLLRNGIIIESDKELFAILEDYDWLLLQSIKKNIIIMA